MNDYFGDVKYLLTEVSRLCWTSICIWSVLPEFSCCFVYSPPEIRQARLSGFGRRRQVGSARKALPVGSSSGKRTYAATSPGVHVEGIHRLHLFFSEYSYLFGNFFQRRIIFNDSFSWKHRKKINKWCRNNNGMKSSAISRSINFNAFLSHIWSNFNTNSKWLVVKLLV